RRTASTEAGRPRSTGIETPGNNTELRSGNNGSTPASGWPLDMDGERTLRTPVVSTLAKRRYGRRDVTGEAHRLGDRAGVGRRVWVVDGRGWLAAGGRPRGLGRLCVVASP